VLTLAFDTATPATTVALVRGSKILAERSHIDPRRHAELLIPTINAVLAEASLTLRDVSDVVVGVGPGAFTGLRVGLVTARSLGDALGVSVHGVVTLDAIAAASGLEQPFVVVTDARRREIFWATYASAFSRDEGPFVGKPEEVAERVRSRPAIGAGATPFAELFGDTRGPDLPSAGALAQVAYRKLAAGGVLPPAAPMYLRRPDVTHSAGPKSVLS
jgi:tRNA threonylcarbamoyl adenosine modification protein YeaZ